MDGIPSLSHDVGYIPYDSKFDNPSYLVCDSTKIGSGRNRIQYVDGANKFKEEIHSKYVYNERYREFSGYVVVRFMVNCKGETDRYRVQSLNLDFSPTIAPDGLLEQSLGLIKGLDNWMKSPPSDAKNDYSKFINLKFDHGKIQHVLL